MPRDVLTDPPWAMKQFFVVGIDAQTGDTRWILPQTPLSDAPWGVGDPPRASAETFLRAGYWVETVSTVCEDQVVILVLRQP